MIRSRYFDPQARKRGEMLRKYRAQYRWRVVRTHSTEPHPDRLDGYGDFARLPSPAGDEWFFTTRAARDRFIAEYGGQAIDG
jgi:hypothetical protein